MSISMPSIAGSCVSVALVVGAGGLVVSLGLVTIPTESFVSDWSFQATAPVKPTPRISTINKPTTIALGTRIPLFFFCEDGSLLK